MTTKLLTAAIRDGIETTSKLKIWLQTNAKRTTNAKKLTKT